MKDLSPGTLIAGRYAVVRPLGRGATKQVFLADDRLSGAQVALCLLVGENSEDPTLSARFSREGRAASVLRSPFVVRVYDVGKLQDGTRYLATEAVLGRGLDDAMKYGAVAPALATRWTIQVLAALSEAHRRGVLHRDVKPENVLLAPAPDGEIAKLTDFGLAKVLDGALEGSLALRTAQNIVLGTPDYMSPEQWQGTGLDHRTDIYSTGVMLYEMLAGHPPFRARMLHAMCLAHLTEEPPPFDLDAPAAVRALEPVVRRALAKRPEQRYQSADEMRADLERRSGVVLGDARETTEPVIIGRYARAELVCEAWPSVVRLVATPNVVLGRESSAHVVIRCLPPSGENALRDRAISLHHAQIEWRGGRAMLSDLGSRTGTFAAGQRVGSDAVEVKNGDEIALGPYVRMAFEHAPCPPGELPRWARLVRTDESGAGQVHVLVLTEAKISSAADAAVWVPSGPAGGDVLRIRSDRAGLSVLGLGSAHAVPLQDGQTLRLGRLVISVAVDA